MIKLGDKVKDIVTGYTGIATSKTEYLNGCIQISVLSPQTKEQAKDCEYPTGVALDIEQLVVVGKGVNVAKVSELPGGPSRLTSGRNKH